MTSESSAGPGDILASFLPRMAVDWLRCEPAVNHRSVTGTAVFADISGFTALTERLAAQGKAGAEEVGEVLNGVFDSLFDAVYGYGAQLIKWGGDAMFLLFDGDRHVERACRGAGEMQKVMARTGRVRTSAGINSLRMSIGVNTGEYHFMLLGRRFRELVATGPAVSDLARMEKVAEATEILVSPATARALAAGGWDLAPVAKGPGYLLTGLPPASPSEPIPVDWTGVDLGQAFPAIVRDYLCSGVSEVEHRNATVAFVRASGIDSLLSEQGLDAATDAVSVFIDACQDAAEAHDIACFTTDVYEDGLKLMLVSGAPVSAGDDEDRVLTAARRVIEHDHRLGVHIGVNSGRLVSGEFGPGYRRTYSIMGDCVNLSARLMSKAGPGQVVASAGVLARARTRFTTEALAPFTVKGKSQPVDAALVGPVARDTTIGPESATPLVGREKELNHLLEAAGALDAGGRVIEVVGPAGMGKSRLIQEVVGRLPVPVLVSESDVYSASAPYSAFHQVFRAALGLSDDAADAELAGALRARLDAAAPHLGEWLALIGTAAGVEYEPTPAVAALDPTSVAGRVQETAAEALRVLVGAPAVVVFNDLHFMDASSRDLLDRVAERTPGWGWLLLATRRDGGERILPGAERLDLEPLDESDASAYLDALGSAGPLLPHLRARLLSHAGGNPLFLMELATDLEALRSEDELPDSVEKVAAARMDRLEPRQRNLLRAASVLGMTADLETLEGVLAFEGLAAGDLEGIDGFLEADAGRRIRFVHDLVRVAAYQGLSFKRRKQLHARAAGVISRNRSDPANQAGILSMHCFHGGLFEEAWEYSRLAGDAARQAAAVAEAATFYRRALAASRHTSSARPDQMIDVSESLAEVLDRLGELKEGEEVLRRARRLYHPGPVQEARLDLKIATARDRAGSQAASHRWLTLGLRALEKEDSEEALSAQADLMVYRARLCLIQGRAGDTARWAETAIAHARTASHGTAEAFGLIYLDHVSPDPTDANAVSPAEQALVIFERLGALAGQAMAHVSVGTRAYHGGYWVNALEHYRAAVGCYNRCGFLWATGIPLANQGEILVQQGHLEAAEAALRDAQAVLEPAGQQAAVAFCLYQRGRVHAYGGEVEAAHGLYAQAARILADCRVDDEVLVVEALNAELALLQGHVEQSRDAATDLLARVSSGTAATNLTPQLLRIRARAHALIGHTDCARDDLLLSLELAQSHHAAHDRAFALQALLELGLAFDQAELWKRDLIELSRQLGLVPLPATFAR